MKNEGERRTGLEERACGQGPRTAEAATSRLPERRAFPPASFPVQRQSKKGVEAKRQNEKCLLKRVQPLFR